MVALVFGTVIAVDVGRLVVGAGPWGLNTFVYVLVTAYSLFRWGSGREMLLGLGLMMVPATTALVFDYTGPAEAIGGFAVFFAVLGIGTAVRYRTGERVRRLEEVRLHEREQFARDLHDTVAHHVSAIAIRAQAGLAVSAARPEAAADALRVIEAEATRALAEMRAMVRLLRRDEPAALAPNPQVADLRQFAGRDGRGSGRGRRARRRPRRAALLGLRRRSTGSPRSRSPTRGGTPATRPGSRSACAPTRRRCTCRCATTAPRSRVGRLRSGTACAA